MSFSQEHVAQAHWIISERLRELGEFGAPLDPSMGICFDIHTTLRAAGLPFCGYIACEKLFTALGLDRSYPLGRYCGPQGRYCGPQGRYCGPQGRWGGQDGADRRELCQKMYTYIYDNGLPFDALAEDTL